ncbi:hypothetical protein ACFQYP_27015 [Nonomuraea antimicrobica]
MESLLILHAVAAACAPWLVARLGRASFALLALPPAAGFAYTIWLAVRGLPSRRAPRGRRCWGWSCRSASIRWPW